MRPGAAADETDEGTPVAAPGSRSLAAPDDARWMRLAIEQAREAERLGEVPVGAVVVAGGAVVATGHNLTHTVNDPSAHAEMIAIRRAAEATGHWRLLDCTLYVTLEPCAMCAGVIVLSRLPRVVFGAYDPKAGMCGSLGNLVQDPRLNHRAELLGGVLEADCGEVLRAFFRTRRAQGKKRFPRDGGGPPPPYGTSPDDPAG